MVSEEGQFLPLRHLGRLPLNWRRQRAGLRGGRIHMDRGKDAFSPGVSDVRRAAPLGLFYSYMIAGEEQRVGLKQELFSRAGL